MRNILIILLFCVNASAQEIDVDWPTTDLKSDCHVLAITVDGQEFQYCIKTKDLGNVDIDAILDKTLKAMEKSK